MKIKMKTMMAGPKGTFGPGSIIDVSEEEGANLVAGGYAEAVPDSPKPAPEVEEKPERKAPEMETTEAPPAPETTNYKPRRGRRK